MGIIKDAFDLAFRDFVTAGVPGTGANEPIKSEVRSIGPAIEQMLSASGIASAIYPTTAAGLAATTDGELFLVQGSGEEFATLWLNDGGVAVDQGISLPSSALVDGVAAAVEALGLDVTAVTDRVDVVEQESAANAANIGGNAFISAATMGLYAGYPVLSIRHGLDGKVEELTTRRGTYIATVNGMALKTESAAIPDYIVNSATGFTVDRDSKIYNILLLSGQSTNSGVGPAGTSVVSTVPVYPSYALMPSIGVRMPVLSPGGTETFPPPTPAFTELVDLVEAADTVNNLYETSASGLVNGLITHVNAQTNRIPRVVALVSAVGSRDYYQLKRGQAAYEWMLRGLRDMVAIIRDRGGTPKVLAVDYCQVEDTHSNQTDSALYAAGLLQYRRNLSADIRAITGQSEEVLLFLDAPQLAGIGPTQNNVIEAHAMAALRDPNIVLAPPFYQMARYPTEPLHLTPIQMRNKGLQLSYAVAESCFGPGYAPMVAKNWWWSAPDVATFEFPRPIAWDTSGQVTDTAPPVYRGWAFDDASGSPPAVTGGNISGKILSLQLASAPTGPRPQFSYANVSNGGSDDAGPVEGARGLLRSADAIVSTPLTLYDWARPAIYSFGKI